MGEYIGVKKFCSLCKYSKLENENLTCINKESDFYNLVTNSVLCAPCFSPKELEKEITVQYIGFD